MPTLFITLYRLIKAVYSCFGDREFRALGVATLTLLACGTLFYHNIEGWRLTDALYFCVMTVTTIGYGDMVPTGDLSRMFTVVYAFVGIGVFVALAAKLATGVVQSDHRNSGTDQ